MVGEISTRRSKDAVEEDVQRLKDWLDKQPHLPHDIEHQLLLAFVYGTKTLEGAKRKLDAYYSNRNRAAKLYDEVGRDVNSQFKEKSKAMKHFMLSKPTPEGYRVYFWTLNDCFDKFFEHPHEATRTLMMLELALMKWPESKGLYLVIDCAGVPASIVTMLSPTILAACLKCYQDGYPIKMKGALIFNAPNYIEFVVNNLVRPVTKTKLFERIKVVNEGSSFLEKYFPVELLPSNYGGKDKSATELNEEWLKLFEENREWFKQSTKISSDEKKRPADSENTYGMEGTFRKLAVD